MKTKRLFIYLPLLLALILGAMGCSDDEEVDANPFVGSWHMVSIEYGDTVKDCSLEPSKWTFHSNGRIKEKDSSISYCYDDQYLYVHHGGQKPFEIVYDYSFSSDYKTLRVKYVKIDLWGGYDTILSTFVGRTEVYHRNK